MERRTFVQMSAAGVAMGAGTSFDGIKIGDRLNPRASEQDLAYFQQSGAEYATIWTTLDNATYEYMSSTKRKVEAAGIQLLNIGILDLHCDPAMVLGLAERDQKIEQYKAYLENLGRAGIGYTTYAHMANIKMGPYYATGSGRTRGAKTRLFDAEKAKNLPLSHGRVYTDDEIWDSFTKFIRAAIVAVANSVRREIARTAAPIVAWFEGSKQQEWVGPGLVSLLEPTMWLECQNEVEILQ